MWTNVVESGQDGNGRGQSGKNERRQWNQKLKRQKKARKNLKLPAF
jgi:hypothetical protein